MVRNLPVKAGDLGNVSLIPGPGGPPGGGKGNPFWYSCLEHSTDGGAWWLQSTGSQRVGHSRVSEHTQHKEMILFLFLSVSFYFW